MAPPPFGWFDDFTGFGPATLAHGLVGGIALDLGRRLNSVWNYGTPIWDLEWDLLIILDACRWDLLREVRGEFEFIPPIDSTVYSPASMSEEWLEIHTADRYTEDLKRTALVSGNINTCWRERFRENWGYLDEVWRHRWDDEQGTVPARAVTDATIDFLRNRAKNHETDRTIAWYFQPHRPFVPVEWSGGFDLGRVTDREKTLTQQNEFKRYRDGDLDRERLWHGYAENLRYVLRDVGLLLENVDAERAVITSDHGNLLGECGVYEHPRNFPHPTLRRVPWVPVEATDTRSYEPAYEPSWDSMDQAAVRTRLDHLGYLD